MRVTVNPAAIADRYWQSRNDNMRIGHWQTGQVLTGDWDLSRRPLNKSLKFDACRRHFTEAIAWEDTKAISAAMKRIARDGKYDDCRNHADVMARYARLDDLWAKTAAAQALPKHLSQHANARDGILTHIDRHGALLFGNQGFHRLSIAKLAKIPEITVVIGVVHPDALRTDAYLTLRGGAT
jgi:hypothetical protein